MNIFETAPEFIEWDNRQAREINRVTTESTYNRLSVQLPDWFVKDNTVLDLGSCLGAAGHMALTNGAKHYTGVEVQEKYVEDSQKIFQKYWREDQFKIVQANLEEFLDECIDNNTTYDCVIASGVLYTFLNVIGILEKISKVADKSILIDNMFAANGTSGSGIIVVRENVTMVNSVGLEAYYGPGSICSSRALDIVLKTTGFYRHEDIIIPPVTQGSHDGYHDLIDMGNGVKSPSRYAVRYHRKEKAVKKLIDIVLEKDTEHSKEFFHNYNIVEAERGKTWSFDESVAERFQQEAIGNIPDYKRVIDMCLQFAIDNVDKSAPIVDIGSALGYTVNKFVNAGFTGIRGIDNSEAMVSKSMHKDRIILSDTLPEQPFGDRFKLIIINWTFHFIVDKLAYMKSMYKNLDDEGYLIITDKTNLTPEVKKMYYDFKRDNGISEDYIADKEKRLAGYMHTVTAAWYPAVLTDLGFRSVEILNARLGFVTYLCKK